jgi:hypothetical protein
MKQHPLCIYSIIFVIGIALNSQSLSAQNISSVKILPNVSFGYTIGKGINGGIGLGVSFIDYKIEDKASYAGLYFSYAMFSHKRELYKNGFYRVFSINAINVINEQLITRVGMAKTKLKWGVNNVNSSFSNGWGIDLDIGIRPVVYSPYIGFRYFQINNSCMGIGATNPKFLYLGYQYPIEIVANIKSTKE